MIFSGNNRVTVTYRELFETCLELLLTVYFMLFRSALFEEVFHQ